MYSPPRSIATPSYELSFAAPGGLSGAPLFRAGTYEVAGVIYGDNEPGTITEFASRDPPTGELNPEVQRHRGPVSAERGPERNPALTPSRPRGTAGGYDPTDRKSTR